MTKLETAPFDLVSLSYLTQFDRHEVRPYQYLTVFRKMRHSGAEGMAAQTRANYQQITAYMDSLDVNYAVLMVEGFVIFTEDALDVNALMVKLATGLDLRGQFEFHLTPWLRSERVTNVHSKLLRE